MRQWIWLVFASSVLLTLTAWRAMTFDSSSQPITMGLVDMEKLVANYQALKQDDEQYRQTVQRRQKMLETRALLEAKEWEELDNLEQKEANGKLTDTERRRLEELRKLSEQRFTELQHLQLKESKNEQERKRLEYLLNLQNSNREKLQKLMQKFEEELTKLNEILTTRHRQRIREAATQVAQQLGLKIIMISDDDLILYAETSLDVTDKVLEILNSSK
ncbi:MAG: OmpH family outer membrane protein [Armatimonadetes bacterium]|nr:OmpH family outer membrane protein [Armatimonadota bacterium]MCX7966878.1 OmpH family outer membrane protein [Armatimonadota bacterium]MDW8141836.1 OmpH family outer membrane protein [Armatimonadota bacterium]